MVFLSTFMRKTSNLGISIHFGEVTRDLRYGEVTGDIRPWLMATWKAHGQLSICVK